MHDTDIAMKVHAVRDVGRLQGLSTTRAIAERCGYSESYFARMLKGERPVTFDRLIEIAAALGVSPTTIASISTKLDRVA